MDTELIKLLTALVTFVVALLGLISNLLARRKAKRERKTLTKRETAEIESASWRFRSDDSVEALSPRWPRPVEYLALLLLILFAIGWSMALEYPLEVPKHCPDRVCFETVVDAMKATPHDLLPASDAPFVVAFFLLLGLVVMFVQDAAFLFGRWRREG